MKPHQKIIRFIKKSRLTDETSWYGFQSRLFPIIIIIFQKRTTRMMLWCCGIATLLHSICVHYGQPAMLLVYSVYIFFMTMSLFFTTVVVADPATATATTTTASFHQKTSGFVGFYTGIASMLTISFLSKVNYPDNANTPNSNSSLLTVTEMVRYANYRALSYRVVYPDLPATYSPPLYYTSQFRV